MAHQLLIAICICIITGTCAASETALPSEDCEQEPDPGICRAMYKKWFYNSTSFRCEVFYYGGCGGNANIFDSLRECNKKCRYPVLGVCALPELKQICRAGFRGYRFDPWKQRCVSYIYCEHNENHFPTKEDCQKKCGKFAQDPCFLPKHAGSNCSSSPAMENFWFNSKTETCETFDYAGCGGNGNNFLYESECWSTCGKYVKSNCNYPISHGKKHCSNGSKEVVFGYNKKDKRCERFVYYGCGGYPNRFHNASECWKTCGRDSGSKCMEPGPKNRFGIVKKYYYDLMSDSCTTSYYSPLSSKKNRFPTLEECLATCKGNYTDSPASF